MTKKLIVLTILVITFVGIVYSLFDFMYIKDVGLFYHTQDTIDEYQVFVTGYVLDKEYCDTIYPYTVLYESDSISLTSYDLMDETGCGKNIYILNGGTLHSLTKAVEKELITEEEVLSYDFDVEIVLRYKAHSPGQVIQVSYQSDNDAGATEPTVIINSKDMIEFLEHFDQFMFKERVDTEIDAIYYLNFELNDYTVTYAITNQGIIELASNRISFFDETDNGLNVDTIESYFTE